MRRSLWVRCTLLLVGLVLPFALAAAGRAAGTVSGLYRFSGKDAPLAHLVLVPHDDYDHQKAVTLVMTEKDASAAEDPAEDAERGAYGAALVVTVQPNGDVIECYVGHPTLKRPIASLGVLHAQGFHWANGAVSGKLTTGGKHDLLYGNTWEADLDVSGKLP